MSRLTKYLLMMADCTMTCLDCKLRVQQFELNTQARDGQSVTYRRLVDCCTAIMPTTCQLSGTVRIVTESVSHNVAYTGILMQGLRVCVGVSRVVASK